MHFKSTDPTLDIEQINKNTSKLSKVSGQGSLKEISPWPFTGDAVGGNGAHAKLPRCLHRPSSSHDTQFLVERPQTGSFQCGKLWVEKIPCNGRCDAHQPDKNGKTQLGLP